MNSESSVLLFAMDEHLEHAWKPGRSTNGPQRMTPKPTEWSSMLRTTCSHRSTSSTNQLIVTEPEGWHLVIVGQGLRINAVLKTFDSNEYSVDSETSDELIHFVHTNHLGTALQEAARLLAATFSGARPVARLVKDYEVPTGLVLLSVLSTRSVEDSIARLDALLLGPEWCVMAQMTRGLVVVDFELKP